jgi:hypothetical protein
VSAREEKDKVVERKMKIAKSQLKQIIKEELEGWVLEAGPPYLLRRSGVGDEEAYFVRIQGDRPGYNVLWGDKREAQRFDTETEATRNQTLASRHDIGDSAETSIEPVHGAQDEPTGNVKEKLDGIFFESELKQMIEEEFLQGFLPERTKEILDGLEEVILNYLLELEQGQEEPEEEAPLKLPKYDPETRKRFQRQRSRARELAVHKKSRGLKPKAG